MTTITPEQRQEIEKAGEGPVRMEDPETHQFYVVIKEEEYQRLREAIEMDQSDLSLHEFEEFIPNP